jgi:predicted amidohydrolase YtcJ
MTRIIASLLAVAVVTALTAALVRPVRIVAQTGAAQQADTVLVNGKILTVDRTSSTREALAIRDRRIVALGTSADVRRLAGSTTRVIDLQGRTVIPGLIDSHMHAIRAALFFATEENWIGASSLTEALARMRAAAQARPGAWLIVAGGWTEKQFTEGRRPTQAELQAAAPSNPVYVQLGYQWAVMTAPAWKALNITGDADLPAGARFERDSSGTITGAVTGPQGAIVALFDKLPKPTYEQKVDGTLKFFRELNRLGITGVVDPGGNNLTPPDYEALQEVWRRKELSVRVAYALCSQTAGSELDELQQLTTLLPMGFGDDMLHFNGIGERITAAMYNNARPTDADEEKFYQVALWAGRRGMSLTIHWGSDASVDHLLSVFERVNREIPIAPLRWSIAHLDDASERTLNRMRALGVGWTMQDAMYFGGDSVLQRGRDAAARTPPIETARRIGVVTGAGTDAHRVASYNPFTALQWLLDGRTVSGASMRGPAEMPSRRDALRLYTSGSAWFSFDDDVRGSLEVGKLADLAVLSKDFMTIPVDQIGGLESLLTMVGGKVVYAAGPYARLEETARPKAVVQATPAPRLLGPALTRRQVQRTTATGTHVRRVSKRRRHEAQRRRERLSFRELDPLRGRRQRQQHLAIHPPLARQLAIVQIDRRDEVLTGRDARDREASAVPLLRCLRVRRANVPPRVVGREEHHQVVGLRTIVHAS